MAAAETAQIAPSAPVPSKRTAKTPAIHAIARSATIDGILSSHGHRHSSTEERVDLGQTEKQERIAGRVGRKARVAEMRRGQQGQTNGLGAEVVEVESRSGARGDDQPED